MADEIILQELSAAAGDRIRAEAALEAFLNAGLLKADFISLTTDDPSSAGAIDGSKGLRKKNNGDIEIIEWDANAASWNGTGDVFAGAPRNQELENRQDTLENRQDSVESKVDAVSDAQSAGVVGYATKADMDADTSQNSKTLALVGNDPTPANNGWYRWDGSSWTSNEGFFSAATVKQWVTSEAFEASNITTTSNGNIATADLVWPDGEAGTIDNVSEDSEGRITTVRYNRPSSKYITQDIDYSGDFPTQTLTATGF